MDGRLFTAPRIAAEIAGGQAIITGDFTKEQAAAIVQLIKQKLKP